MSERPIPSVGPPWLPRVALTIVALSSVAFLILWRLEAGKLDDERFRHSVAKQRLGYLCGSVETQYSMIANNLTPTERTAMQERLLPVQLESARYTNDLLGSLFSNCVPPDPSKAEGRPSVDVMTMISEFDTEERMRAAAVEMGGSASWHADALKKARATEWGAREWEAFERKLKSR